MNLNFSSKRKSKDSKKYLLLETNDEDLCQLTEEIEDNYNWNHIETTPRDVLLFDSYAPHRSGPNTTNKSRRIFYFTYNEKKYGNLYDTYFDKKRIEFPPDIERSDTPVRIKGNKYNLANPIE